MRYFRRPTFLPRRAGALFGPLALLALSACAQIDDARHSALNMVPGRIAPKTAALTAPLYAASRPVAPLAGDFVARDLVTGAAISFDVASRSEGVTVRQTDGCVWTRRGDWFAPSSAWENCDGGGAWTTGRADVREIASIWPLREGAEGGFTRNAVSASGRTYVRETRCRVTGAESVIRESGALTPAWVVACEDGKRTRTTWWAPGEGPIAFRKSHKTHGVEEAWVRL